MFADIAQGNPVIDPVDFFQDDHDVSFLPVWPVGQPCFSGGGLLSGGLEGGGQVFPAGLELSAPEAQPLLQDVPHELPPLLRGQVPDGLEVEVGAFTVDSPGAHGEAELNVGLDLPGVGGAVEEPELHGALGEESVEVDAVVPGGVVVLVVDTTVISVVQRTVPHPLDVGLGLVGGLLHGLEHSGIHFPAPAVGAVSDLEGFVEEVLAADGEVQEAGQGFRRVVRAVHVDVDPAGPVGEGPGFPKGADHVLEIVQVFVLKNRRDHFAGVVASGVDLPAVVLPLGVDASVAHGLPGAALAVRGAVGLVVGADEPAGGSEVGGDDLCGLLAGDAGQLNLDAEVLLLHHFVHGISPLTLHPPWFIMGEPGRGAVFPSRPPVYCERFTGAFSFVRVSF